MKDTAVQIIRATEELKKVVQENFQPLPADSCAGLVTAVGSFTGDGPCPLTELSDLLNDPRNATGPELDPYCSTARVKDLLKEEERNLTWLAFLNPCPMRIIELSSRILSRLASLAEGLGFGKNFVYDPLGPPLCISEALADLAEMELEEFDFQEVDG